MLATATQFAIQFGMVCALAAGSVTLQIMLVELVWRPMREGKP
jgi:hypothetical protein